MSLLGGEELESKPLHERSLEESVSTTNSAHENLPLTKVKRDLENLRRNKPEWREMTTPDKACTFFFNAKTEETSFKKPIELIQYDIQKDALKARLQGMENEQRSRVHSAGVAAARAAAGTIKKKFTEGKMDIDEAVISTKDGLRQARKQWSQLERGVGRDGRSTIHVVFHAGITSSRGLTARVAAMGISVYQLTKKEAVPTGATYPLARIAGDSNQPCLSIFWEPSSQAKTTLRLSKKHTSITAHGKRGAMEKHLDNLLVFFGPPVQIKGAAPGDSEEEDGQRSIFDYLK